MTLFFFSFNIFLYINKFSSKIVRSYILCLWGFHCGSGNISLFHSHKLSWDIPVPLVFSTTQQRTLIIFTCQFIPSSLWISFESISYLFLELSWNKDVNCTLLSRTEDRCPHTHELQSTCPVVLFLSVWASFLVFD